MPKTNIVLLRKINNYSDVTSNLEHIDTYDVILHSYEIVQKELVKLRGKPKTIELLCDIELKLFILNKLMNRFEKTDFFKNLHGRKDELKALVGAIRKLHTHVKNEYVQINSANKKLKSGNKSDVIFDDVMDSLNLNAIMDEEKNDFLFVHDLDEIVKLIDDYIMHKKIEDFTYEDLNNDDIENLSVMLARRRNTSTQIPNSLNFINKFICLVAGGSFSLFGRKRSN